jgi:hypothetical protein
MYRNTETKYVTGRINRPIVVTRERDKFKYSERQGGLSGCIFSFLSSMFRFRRCFDVNGEGLRFSFGFEFLGE